MKEILCRAKRCCDDEWVEGFYVKATHHWHKHGVHKDWIICGASANGGWFALHQKYAVKGDTVGLFTGKVVKTGKVFEGDIGKNIDGLFLVRWSEEKSAFVMNFQDYPYEELYLEEMWDDTEIIGNIHDNFNLLNAEPKEIKEE